MSLYARIAEEKIRALRIRGQGTTYGSTCLPEAEECEVLPPEPSSVKRYLWCYTIFFNPKQEKAVCEVDAGVYEPIEGIVLAVMNYSKLPLAIMAPVDDFNAPNPSELAPYGLDLKTAVMIAGPISPACTFKMKVAVTKLYPGDIYTLDVVDYVVEK